MIIHLKAAYYLYGYPAPMPTAWLEAVVRPAIRQFNLPVEQIKMPNGRCWPAMQPVGRAWMSHTDEDAIIEIWEDCGDDGHTEYTLHGYGLISLTDLDLYCQAMHTAMNIGEMPYLQRESCNFIHVVRDEDGPTGEIVRCDLTQGHSGNCHNDEKDMYFLSNLTESRYYGEE
jgi:hypothetical protein